jgi:hypothetical protein
MNKYFNSYLLEILFCYIVYAMCVVRWYMSILQGQAVQVVMFSFLIGLLIWANSMFHHKLNNLGYDE